MPFFMRPRGVGVGHVPRPLIVIEHGQILLPSDSPRDHRGIFGPLVQHGSGVHLVAVPYSSSGQSILTQISLFSPIFFFFPKFLWLFNGLERCQRCKVFFNVSVNNLEHLHKNHFLKRLNEFKTRSRAPARTHLPPSVAPQPTWRPRSHQSHRPKSVKHLCAPWNNDMYDK